MELFFSTRSIFGRAARLSFAFSVLSIAFIGAAGQTAKSKSSLRPFSFKSGDFNISYDTKSGLITVGRTEKQIALATRLAGGRLFDAALPQFARTVSLQNTGNVSRAIITSERDWAKFQGTIETYKNSPGLVRFRLDVTTKKPTNIADSMPEFYFVNPKTGKTVQHTSTVYNQQGGIEAPVVYLYNEDLDSLLLYFQNLTSLNKYIEYVQGDPRYTVGADKEGFGFKRPQGIVPGGVTFTINDAYLWLSLGRPVDDTAYSKQFLQGISRIYDRLEKPPTVYTDWAFEIAPQSAKDLMNPINGVSAGGTRVLKAYVGEKERPPESIVSLDVLIPARQYARKFGADENLSRLIADIEKGLDHWYVPLDGRKVFSNFSFPKREQDAWYFIHPLVQITELALEDNEKAKTMLLSSVPKLIEVGQAMNYEFSFMLDVVENKRANDIFREYDTLGGYAYVMLGCYKLTGEAKYLEEAKKAVEHIRGKGFGFTYEPHYTAITLESLGWLYQLTGDSRYIELSYLPLANLFAMTWLWEPDYGYAKSYQLFLGINPVPSADQVAAFEIHNVWWYLSRFYLRAENALPAYTRKLIAEYLKYQLTVGHFTLPRFLPGEALSKTPDWGEIRREMAIPVEDLKDGFHKSAMVGQEIYGCGEVFRFASDAYQVFGARRDVVLYSEYPVTSSGWKESASSLEFALGGVPDYSSRVRIYFREANRGASTRAAVKQLDRQISLRIERKSDYIEFYAPGGTRYQVLLNQKPLARISPNENAAANAVPAVRVAGILGTGGVIQAKIGGVLSIPIVVTNPSPSASKVSFEAELPAGWRMENLEINVAPGASASRSLRVRVPADLKPDALHQIAVRMRRGKKLTTVLETMVRGISDVDGEIIERFDAAPSWFQPIDRNSSVSASEGTGAFTITDGILASFETRTLTVDMDKNPQVNLGVLSHEGQFAMKIYEVGSSPFGIYILPQVPVVPEQSLDNPVRVNLKERTGWSGIHSFRLGLYVVGRKGDALRLRDWNLSFAE